MFLIKFQAIFLSLYLASTSDLVKGFSAKTHVWKLVIFSGKKINNCSNKNIVCLQSLSSTTDIQKDALYNTQNSMDIPASWQGSEAQHLVI